jgi:hypothetical protein
MTNCSLFHICRLLLTNFPRATMPLLRSTMRYRRRAALRFLDLPPELQLKILEQDMLERQKSSTYQDLYVRSLRCSPGANAKSALGASIARHPTTYNPVMLVNEHIDELYDVVAKDLALVKIDFAFAYLHQLLDDLMAACQVSFDFENMHHVRFGVNFQRLHTTRTAINDERSS